ncbi:MAG: AAA domain-containing protein [bacterium]|nr:AAA domain-containing protein [bacterium]
MHWHNFDTYANQQEQWLAMESDAERQRLAARRQLEKQGDAEKGGETIVDLRLADYRTGLAGRILLDLVKSNGKRLPLNRLKVGSPVVLSDSTDLKDQGIGGVVSKRNPDSIQVAVENWPEAKFLRLDLSPDETTRKRQLSALATARRLTGRSARLRDTLLGLQEPRFDALSEYDFATSLNASQQQAVAFALSARDVAIIHGPPGTGKTTTLAEVILQAVRSGQRVLACAPSNTAVDNLLERLVDMLPSVVRVGHPARVFEWLRGHTLDELVEADESTAIVQEMWRDVEELMRTASRYSRSRHANRNRGELYAQAGRLRQEARALERRTVRYILQSSDVICTTTTVDEELLADQKFDLVVIDEACQCTEPAIWQAALRGERIVLAGDHCQLPPTVVSAEAAKQGFDISTMERLIQRFDHEIFRRLTVQYRMNTHIMNFSSEQFYDKELVADVSVAEHSLRDLSGFDSQQLADVPVQFWDTAGASWEEELEPDGLSKRNPQEATWVIQQARQLLESGLPAEELAIIAPYAAQVRLIRDQLNLPGLEIDTVDGFQGREKEAVIVSFVRSNTQGEIGFLRDIRRTNVAWTRARRGLWLIGDSATLAAHPFYQRLVEYVEEQGGYHSVWELGAQ